MTDISIISQEALAKLFESGKVHEMIERQLESTVADIIKDTLKNYSEFGKQLRAAIESRLPTKFDDLGMSEYNHFVAKAVRAKLSALENQQWRIEIENMLDEMLRVVGPELKLSALAVTVRDHFQGHNYNRNDSFTFLIEESGHRDGYYRVYFDEEPDKVQYRCEYQLAVTKDGEVYGCKINDSDPKKSLFVGPFYGLERLLMQLYHGNTKLIRDIDADDVDTSLDGRHCD